MAEEEIWKDIEGDEGYEGIYQVSDLGQIKSLKHGKEIYLKFGIDGCGYQNVKLSRLFIFTNFYPDEFAWLLAHGAVFTTEWGVLES